MQEAGFRTCLLGKTHVNPASCVEDYVDLRAIKDANFSKRDLGRYARIAGQFMRADAQPFFITVNYPDAHWPVQNQVQGRPKTPQGPETVEPMEFIAFDNERMHTPIQGYYNCLQRLD